MDKSADIYVPLILATKTPYFVLRTDFQAVSEGRYTFVFKLGSYKESVVSVVPSHRLKSDPLKSRCFAADDNCR